MKYLLLALALLTPFATCVFAQTRFVTLSIDTRSPRPGNQTNSYTLGPNESAELVSWPWTDGNSQPPGEILVEKDNTVYAYSAANAVFGNQYNKGVRETLIWSGPAILSYRQNGGGYKAFATFKITPAAFPPDKTFIILDGTPGAAVTLECSTNLLTWATATNGFYTGTNGAKFFRINAQRTP